MLWRTCAKREGVRITQNQRKFARVAWIQRGVDARAYSMRARFREMVKYENWLIFRERDYWTAYTCRKSLWRAQHVYRQRFSKTGCRACTPRRVSIDCDRIHADTPRSPGIVATRFIFTSHSCPIASTIYYEASCAPAFFKLSNELDGLPLYHRVWRELFDPRRSFRIRWFTPFVTWKFASAIAGTIEPRLFRIRYWFWDSESDFIC